MMTLVDLVGPHLLTGCDMDSDGDANAIVFVLDGTAHRAQEDPDDGYRSYMGELSVSEKPVRNVFPAVSVVGRLAEGNDDVLELIDAATGKTVLEVGTDHSDDYYPSFVGSFTPENMTVKA
jgi:hypothetical protein